MARFTRVTKVGISAGVVAATAGLMLMFAGGSSAEGCGAEYGTTMPGSTGVSSCPSTPAPKPTPPPPAPKPVVPPPAKVVVPPAAPKQAPPPVIVQTVPNRVTPLAVIPNDTYQPQAVAPKVVAKRVVHKVVKKAAPRKAAAKNACPTAIQAAPAAQVSTWHFPWALLIGAMLGAVITGSLLGTRLFLNFGHRYHPLARRIHGGTHADKILPTDSVES